MIMITIYNKINETAKQIRNIVFIKEQGFSYDEDDTDNISKHVIYYLNNIPIGVCRYFINNEKGIYHLGRFAILKEYRNCGYGKKMLLEVIKQIKKENGKEIHISSQLHAIPFYEKLGFKVKGDIYYEQQCPHKDMIITL